VTVLPTFDMLLFGGTGDLVTRKLLPALYRRYAAGQVSAQSRIFGIARTELSRLPGVPRQGIRRAAVGGVQQPAQLRQTGCGRRGGLCGARDDAAGPR
jgi:hypothetical protein